ncbi:MAG: hypothetical protein NUW01_09665 [Gemmatimonadaceae bacterium]|nr:hypothetical protein [Gemmatimonadaceae bacterium]
MIKVIPEPPIRLTTPREAIKNPPYDGSPACPTCPVEVRNLLAVVHNYLNALGRSDPSRVARKLADLRDAAARLQPIADAHFADPMHSHGELPSARLRQKILNDPDDEPNAGDGTV